METTLRLAQLHKGEDRLVFGNPSFQSPAYFAPSVSESHNRVPQLFSTSATAFPGIVLGTTARNIFDKGPGVHSTQVLFRTVLIDQQGTDASGALITRELSGIGFRIACRVPRVNTGYHNRKPPCSPPRP